MKKAWAYIWKHSAENLILFNSIYTVLLISSISFSAFMPDELMVDEFVHHWMTYVAMTITILLITFAIIQFAFGAYEFLRWFSNKANFRDGYMVGVLWVELLISLFLPIAPSLVIIQYADFSGKTRKIWNPIKKIQIFLNRPKAPAILYNVLLWTFVMIYALLAIFFGIVDDSNPNDTKPAWLNLIMTLSILSALLMFFIQFHFLIISTNDDVYTSGNERLLAFFQSMLIILVPYYWTLLLVTHKQK